MKPDDVSDCTSTSSSVNGTASNFVMSTSVGSPSSANARALVTPYRPGLGSFSEWRSKAVGALANNQRR
jgi:hypothetical protein